MKAKRRVTTNKNVRAGKRTPTVRKIKPLLGSSGSGPALAAATRPRAIAAREPVHVAAAPEPFGGVAVDLAVDLGRGLVLPNPILVASGTFGYGIEYGDVVEVDRLGAICCKGTTLRPRVGNIAPRVTE